MPLRYDVPIGGTGSFPSGACFGDVDGGDYGCFDENGWFQSFGDGRSWKDFNFGVGKVAIGASAPDLINLGSTTIETLGFNGINTPEEVSVALEMDHNWAEGTIIKPHVHWYPTTAAAGNVKWQMEWTVVYNEVVPASATIAVVQATGGVAWDDIFASFADVDLVGYPIGAQFHLRLFRDPTDLQDTYGADAAIATFGLHVIIDSFGSRQVATK